MCRGENQLLSILCQLEMYRKRRTLNLQVSPSPYNLYPASPNPAEPVHFKLRLNFATKIALAFSLFIGPNPKLRNMPWQMANPRKRLKTDAENKKEEVHSSERERGSAQYCSSPFGKHRICCLLGTVCILRHERDMVIKLIALKSSADYGLERTLRQTPN